MPGILNRPLTHRFKPPSGSGLHRTHPFTVGMCGAYLLNDGGANAQFRNYARNVGHLSQSVAGYQGGKVGQTGSSVGTDGTGLLSGANPLGATSNVSIACRFRVTAAPSGQQGVYSIGTVKDDGSPLFVLDTNAGGTLLQSLIGDDAFSTIVGTLVVGQWYTHVATWGPSGGTQAEFIGYGANAVQIVSRAYTLNAVNSTSIFLGSGYANPLASDFEFLYLWNRVLKYREALDLIADPYQMWDYRASRAVKKPSGGGGTAFTNSLSGTITPSATLAKAAAKPLAGTGTLSAAFTKAAAANKTGTATPAGAIAKAAAKPMVGAATPSGALAKAPAKSLAGAITATTSAVVKACAKGLTGTATITTTLAKACAKPLTGSTAFSAALSKAVAIRKSGTATLSAVLTKAIARFQSGAAMPSGSLSKSTAKSGSGTLAPSGNLTVQPAIGRTFTGTITATGAAVVKAIGKGITGLLSLTGLFSKTGGAVIATPVIAVGAFTLTPRTLTASIADRSVSASITPRTLSATLTE